MSKWFKRFSRIKEKVTRRKEGEFRKLQSKAQLLMEASRGITGENNDQRLTKKES
jgi:hypothetical protein